MKNLRLFVVIAIAVLGSLVFAYANHFHNSFHFDDGHTIENNVNIRSIDILKFFSDSSTFSVLPANQTYRPLFVSILALEYWAGGGQPLCFHIGAFLCYLCLGILLFFLFRQIFSLTRPNKDHSIIALLGASFFLLHTANAETVNYLSAGSDLFSTTFMTAALVIYALWPHLRKYGFYILPAAMAMLIKEVSVVFPLFLLIFILYERKCAQESKKKILVHPLLAIMPSTLVCLALLVLSFAMIPKSFTPSAFTRLEYILAQPFVIVHYFNSFFLPFNLSADTDWKTIKNIFDDRVLIGLVFICSLIFLTRWTWKKHCWRPISFGLSWFFIGVFPPSSGIVILAEVLNDHRMFLPFAGLTMAATWAMVLLFEKYYTIFNRYVFIIIIAIFGGHAYGTLQRNKVWKNPESLWYDVTQKSPTNGRGLMNYGLCLMAKGKSKEALSYFERALVFNPFYEYLHINIAIALDQLGDKVKAEEHFSNALRYNANYYGSYFFYARFLEKHNRYGEAMPLLTKAISISPNFMDSRYLLMKIHSKTKDFKELAQIVNDTLKRWPNDKTSKAYYERLQNKLTDSTEHKAESK